MLSSVAALVLFHDLVFGGSLFHARCWPCMLSTVRRRDRVSTPASSSMAGRSQSAHLQNLKRPQLAGLVLGQQNLDALVITLVLLICFHHAASGFSKHLFSVRRSQRTTSVAPPGRVTLMVRMRPTVSVPGDRAVGSGCPAAVAR